MTRKQYRIPLLNIILLSTLGISALAWFINRKKKSALPPPSAPKSSSSQSTNGAVVQMDDERDFVNMMKQQGRKVIFFYGSQTGTAEDYASRLAKQCSQTYGVSCITADIEEYDLSFLDKVPEDCLVVFIMATYGEGEPTDNAVDFWELMTQENPEFSESTDPERPLSNLRYVAFGLGNKTYEHYNSVIRTVDKQLLDLGAQRIGERGEGDDDGSMEEDFLGWQEEMWPAFCEALGIDKDNLQSSSRQPVWSVEELIDYDHEKVYLGELSESLKSEARAVYDAKRPYTASINSRDLFKSSDRHCLHIEIDITGSGLHYDTGDHVAIWPTNNEVEVERLARVLGITDDKLDTVIRVKALDKAASKQIPFPVPATYRAILRHYLDICSTISRSTLMSFVEFAPSEAAKEKLRTLATDKDTYRVEIGDVTRNLGEVLETVSDTEDLFKSVPFDLIVESLSRLQPRYYSISSSAKEDPHTITVTAVTLQYDASERTVYGVNTNYLWRIHEALNGLEPNTTIPTYHIHGPRDSFYNTNNKVAKVPVHVRHSQFKLPRNNEVPIIMIGPGTGVAPFRGFVRERVLNKKQGKTVGTTVLFFGCRSEVQDFLYDNEWPELFQELEGDSRIITAFSRDTDKKVYVQHRLMEHAQEMWELLNQGAYVYVCGDAKVMARDVNNTFVQFAHTLGGLDEDKAHDYVKNLRNIGRYQEDVWS